MAALGFHCCAAFLYVGRAGATLHCGAWASHCSGFSCCGAQARALGVQTSVVVACGLWSTGSVAVVHEGLVAPLHVGSSWTRDRTRVPCIGRQILNHCATREAPIWFNVSFKAYVSLFIFIFHDLSFGECGVSMSPTIIVLLSISPFMAVSICLMY